MFLCITASMNTCLASNSALFVIKSQPTPELTNSDFNSEAVLTELSGRPYQDFAQRKCQDISEIDGIIDRNRWYNIIKKQCGLLEDT